MKTPEERITELETKVAFMEQTNQELSDLIYAQQQQIDKHLRDIARNLESLQESHEQSNPADEKPPHY